MKVQPAPLSGVLLIEPRVFGDSRGFFEELFHEERYRKAGLGDPFRQDNLSRSAKGTLRGLHFQEPRAQGKLVQVLDGSVFDVAVDVRRGSPSFGRWFGVDLSGANKLQLWIPPGFAHGFCVTSEQAYFFYKCTDLYSPEHERAVLWNDPEIGIRWPIEHPVLSEKDAAAPRLHEAPVLPHFREDGV